MALAYVGGQVGGFAGKTGTSTITFTLTGGLAATPATGDLVIVAYHVGGTSDVALTITGASIAYTLAGSELYQNDTYDSNLRVGYRFMPATPDTTVVLSGTGSVQNAGCYTIHVFRNVDSGTPMDVTVVTAGNINTRIANPGPITPVTAGAWIYCVGGAATLTGGTYTAAYLTDFRAGTTSDTVDSQIGAGYYSGWSSGQYDPAAFGGGGTDTLDDSWTAVTIALRPAVGPVELTNVGNIASLAAVGLAILTLALSPVGIATTGTFGTQNTGVTIAATGIAGAEVFGTTVVTPQTGVSLTNVGNIGTGEAHGTQIVGLTLAPSGIATGAVFGSQNTGVTVVAVGIVGAEAFGVTTVTPEAPPIELTDVGNIGSAEGFGAPNLSSQLAPVAIVSQEVFGLANTFVGLYPAITDVKSGIQYGPMGIEFTGTVEDEMQLDDVVEGSVTVRHLFRYLMAFVAGKATGGGTTSIAYQDQANTKDRIVLTVDALGNRSAVVVDGT